MSTNQASVEQTNHLAPFCDETNACVKYHKNTSLSLEAIHRCGDKEYSVSRGDAWLLSIYDNHQAICDKGLNIINIAIKPELLNEKLFNYTSITHPLICHFNEKETKNFLQKTEELTYEQTVGGPFSILKAASLLNEMAIDIIRNSSHDIEINDLGIIQDISAWVQRHFKEDISLSQLAEKFSLTPNYLGRLFQKNMGISYNSYINSLRLNNACHLLLVSEKSVKDIALESGYNSVEYFNSIFKKYYGVSPSKYRGIAEQSHEKKNKHMDF